MPRDYKLYLEDILEAIAKIQQYTEGLSVEMLSSDPKTLDAVAPNLEVIGEAVKMLPEEIRSRQPEVEASGVAAHRSSQPRPDPRGASAQICAEAHPAF